METFVIAFNPLLCTALVGDLTLGLEHMDFSGERYHLVGGQQCFEWLFGEDGSVVGVELCTRTSDPVWAGNSESVDNSELFPRIWFGRRRDGASRQLQDWEDYYYRSEDGKLLIALKTHMLTNTQREQLRELSC